MNDTSKVDKKETLSIKPKEFSQEGKPKRRQRVPFGQHRRRLSIPEVLQEDKAHHYHWINDTQDRVQRALIAGYEYVEKKDLGDQDIGDPGLHNGNSNLNSRVSRRLRDFEVFLMRIPIEFYEEDRALKAANDDEIDRAIKKGGKDRLDQPHGFDVRVDRA